jgi:hypothetical protein
MAKLQELFAQARRGQSGGGMGFLGKNRTEAKARSAALVVDLPRVTAGNAEAALKAGADGILFNWDGKDEAVLATFKKEIESARASNEQLVSGLRLTGNLARIDSETFIKIKEQGFQYTLLPFNAPARLLALETKELEKVVIVPMRTDELYPLYIRNLTALDGIAAVLLDFALEQNIASLTIEEVLNYRAVREAVRYPAFLRIPGELSENDAYTLVPLDAQAVILSANAITEKTSEQIKNVRSLLEKTHKDEKDQRSPSISIGGRKGPEQRLQGSMPFN